MTEKDRCHDIIGRLYERPVFQIDGGLTVVSMPRWMDAQDVDLIKTALKERADRQT